MDHIAHEVAREVFAAVMMVVRTENWSCAPGGMLGSGGGDGGGGRGDGGAGGGGDGGGG